MDIQIDMARAAERLGNFDASAEHWKHALSSSHKEMPHYWDHVIEGLYVAAKASRSNGHPAFSNQNYYEQKLREFRETIAGIDGFNLPANLETTALKLKAMTILGDAGALDELQTLVTKSSVFSNDSDLEPVLRNYFGAHLDGAHAWILATDIVAERMLLISKVIIPYATKHLPKSALFVALKELELSTLLAGGGLPTFNEIASTIEAVRNGEAASKRPATPAATPPRAMFPDPLFRLLLSVAHATPELLLDLKARLNQQEFGQALRKLGCLVPTFLVCTDAGFPLGGGELFMHQSCRIMHEFGFLCVWTSFSDGGLKPYKNLSLSRTPYYIDHRQPGGVSATQIEAAICKWSPDVVHSQSVTNEHVSEICSQLRIPALIGYHFWEGFVELGAKYNQRIVENVRHHKLVRKPQAMNARSITRYVASDFMKSVYGLLGGREQLKVYYPIPDPGHYEIDQPGRRSHVLQINISRLKGGPILLACLRKLGQNIPFFVVKTEPLSEKLDAEIKAAVERSAGSIYAEYGSVKSYYAHARMVIVPTAVDETFCRVAFEAAMNGIPVVCTRNGFLPDMLGDTGVYLEEDPSAWSDCIQELFEDTDRLERIGNAQRTRLTTMFGNIPSAFIDGALRSLRNSPKRNVGIFTAWSEQGLGYQARQYAELFRKAGYHSHIFSFQPYAAMNAALTVQHNPSDWCSPEHADTIHYSYNDREHVTPQELEQFIRANNVGTLVVPEVCWPQNWSRLNSIEVDNLCICTVPNIETVRKSEIQLHNSTYSTWYNTKIAQTVLTDRGVRNGIYIGHGFGKPRDVGFSAAKQQQLNSRDYISFVHIGGHNSIQRKQTPKVLAAFVEASKFRRDIHLTVTMMSDQSEYIVTDLPPNVTLIDRILSHAEILKLYECCDVSIQVSSHEGLGLGFYELISRGTPVISLDVPPHNEVVLRGKTGWLLKTTDQALPDNDDGIVKAAKFRIKDLTHLLKTLSRADIEPMIVSTCKTFSEQFNELALFTRLLEAMPSEIPLGEVSRRPECFLKTSGAMTEFGRGIARSIWQKERPEWVRIVARSLRALERHIRLLRISINEPACCRIATATGQTCLERGALQNLFEREP